MAPLDILAPLHQRRSPPLPMADRQLASPPPCTRSSDPRHPAMVFISPGPRCAYLQQALGKMATLGDGQEPPRVPSPVNLASPGTPGTHRLEARLHLHGHQHGTHPALRSLHLPAPPAPPAPQAARPETRQLTAAGAPAPLHLGRDMGSRGRGRRLSLVSNGSLGDSPPGPCWAGRALCPLVSLYEPLLPHQENRAP